MSKFEDLVNANQLQTVVDEICEKNKLVFVSRTTFDSLNTQIQTLTETIENLNTTIASLEARVEALEPKEEEV